MPGARVTPGRAIYEPRWYTRAAAAGQEVAAPIAISRLQGEEPAKETLPIYTVEREAVFAAFRYYASMHRGCVVEWEKKNAYYNGRGRPRAMGACVKLMKFPEVSLFLALE